MATNTKNILAGISAGASGTSLCFLSSVGAAAPTSATSALSTTSTSGVQTVTITGTPTGGTFTLTYAGSTTSAIAYNAAAGAVQSALQALPTIGTGNATVTGAGPYTVTFAGALANQAVSTLTGSGALLTGGTSPSVTVAVTTAGVSGWVDAGWCSDKGLTVKLSETVNDIAGFGTITPVRKIITKSEQNFDVEFLESNLTTLAVYNRKALNQVTTAAGSGGEIDFSTGGAGLPHYAVVFDMVDGSNHIRAYCPDVAVTGKSDLVMGAGQAVTYPVSLTAFPDSSGNAINWFYLVSALSV